MKTTLKYIAAALLIFSGFGAIRLGGYYSAFFHMLGGLLCLPFVFNFLEKKLKNPLNSGIKYATVITLLVLGMVFMPKDEQNRDRIEAASEIQVKNIEKSFKDKTLVILKSCAIKSNDFGSVYFVGAKLSNGKIGVWSISGSKTDTNIHLSVNDIAKECSRFPQNTNRTTMGNHGAQEVYDYLETRGN